eukprot:m.176320 g.176320  ORF g.176320 m.176320 type:complete len:591 (-) comp17363_c1_seq3:1576-3348(-)
MFGRRRLPRLLLIAVACAAGYYLFVMPPSTAAAGSSSGVKARDSNGAGGAAAAAAVKSDKPAFQPKNADEEHMHGVVGADAQGKPLFSVKPMPPDETAEQKREHHKGNCFNLARSDSLPLDRPIPDVRSEQCKKATYPHDLPDTSIVFVFFNEPASPLLRSVHSVLNRSPPHLIREIILVDDGSDAEWLLKPLEDYIATLPKVKLVRTHARTGLMRARTIGAENAIGDTVTFLDSHIECNKGWLEPLLYRVYQDRRHVVMPIIDSIHPDAFTYNQGGLDILGFSWGLGQKGIGMRQRTQFEPMPSPIMAGGLFTIDRKLFFELGGYDPDMHLYGGEEMEISFRIWQCGGTLECMPCSRVYHIFRKGGHAYSLPAGHVQKNRLRTARIWMDEYAFIAEAAMGNPTMDIGPLEGMKQLRSDLKCKSFDWFLKNVYPEALLTDLDELLAFGTVESKGVPGQCIDATQAYAGGQGRVTQCNDYQQMMVLSTGEILPIRNLEMCLTDKLKFDWCGRWRKDTRWQVEGKAIKHIELKKCLTVKKENGNAILVLEDCNNSEAQQWELSKKGIPQSAIDLHKSRVDEGRLEGRFGEKD